MPIYEYVCPSCDARFSRLSRHIEAGGMQPCPVCGAGSGRALSSFALHLSMSTKISQIDPRLEREINAAERKSQAPIDMSNLT